MKETVGAMELTEDYSAYRDSCRTHAHTHLGHNVCVCEEEVYARMPQSKQSRCDALQQVGLQVGEMSVTYADTLSFFFFLPAHILPCTPHQQKCLVSSVSISLCVRQNLSMLPWLMYIQ